MAVLTVQDVSRVTGLELTPEAAAGGGDSLPNDGKTFLYIRNDDVAGITLTAVTQQQVDGLAVADKTYAIGASETWLIGPFPSSIYNDGNNRVALTYSGVTDLFVAAIRFVGL